AGKAGARTVVTPARSSFSDTGSPRSSSWTWHQARASSDVRQRICLCPRRAGGPTDLGWPAAYRSRAPEGGEGRVSGRGGGAVRLCSHTTRPAGPARLRGNLIHEKTRRPRRSSKLE